MTRRRPFCPMAVIALALLAAAWPHAVPASGQESVWCHDAGHAVVTRMPRWRCEGEVVDDATAERIRQDRVRRIQRVLQREREPLLPQHRQTGSGSGFFVSSAGHVVTNRHVVQGCKALTVVPAGGEEAVAELLAASEGADLALLRARPVRSPAAVLRAGDHVAVHEAVTVVGYPSHGRVVIRPTREDGQVHDAMAQAVGAVFAVQADIRSGHSGGPVLDATARVIGVVFAAVNTPAVYQATGRRVDDIGLAVGLAPLRTFLARHDVPVQVSNEAPRLDARQRFERAQDFVAQVRCWR